MDFIERGMWISAEDETVGIEDRSDVNKRSERCGERGGGGGESGGEAILGVRNLAKAHERPLRALTPSVVPHPLFHALHAHLDYLAKLRIHPRVLLVLEKSRKLESREA